MGWVLWKQNLKDDADALWRDVYSSPESLELDRLSALCGMAMYNAEKGNKEMVKAYIFKIEKQLESVNKTDIRFTVTLNSLGIALAKIGEYEEAEKILQEAIRLNTLLIENKESHKNAVHQGSKNRYNLGSLVYQKLGRNDDAFRVFNEAIAGYKEVEAETDLAALYYRLAMTGPEDKKLDYLILSAELWYVHQDDDSDRWLSATQNIYTEVKRIYPEEKEHCCIIKEVFEGITQRMDPILGEKRRRKS